MNPAFYVIEIILAVVVMVMIAKEHVLIRFERKVVRWFRQKITDLRARKLENAGLTVTPAPAMTAEEIVKVCNSL